MIKNNRGRSDSHMPHIAKLMEYSESAYPKTPEYRFQKIGKPKRQKTTVVQTEIVANFV